MLSLRARRIIAKTDKDNADVWLPLWMHAMDVAGIMNMLASHWLPENVRGSMCISGDVLQKLCVFIGMGHDIGKCTMAFLKRLLMTSASARVNIEWAGMSSVMRNLPIDTEQTPHALASEVLLSRLGVNVGIASIAGAHHGKPQCALFVPEEHFMKCPTHFYEKGDKQTWESLWREWMDFALEESGFSSVEELPTLPMSSQVILTGLLIMADWIASNAYYFPLIPVGEEGKYEQYPKRVTDAYKKIGLPSFWIPESDDMGGETFYQRFGFSANPVQTALLDAARGCVKPGIFILEAMMGVGKTEAALGASDSLAGSANCGGLFFGLPTQATANGIFPRLLKWAQAQSENEAHAIRLAHGMANLNENYEELFTGTANVSDESDDSGVFIHQWFKGRKQALLADFVIGTVDQLLMAALKQKHVMLRHLGIAGKVVILDEVHAYSVVMMRYLDMALHWLGVYGVPVIVLSATLPSQRRAELVSAYLGKRADPDFAASVKNTLAYPLLTWTDAGVAAQTAIHVSEPPRVVAVNRLDRELLCETLKTALSDGGCAGVIMNTVRGAIEVAREVRKQLPDMRVILCHASFAAPDRADWEREVLQSVGKASTPMTRDRLIVVGTQIIEQSLDLDFDVMATELCPMDLLLQRLGRLHRHNRVRPSRLRRASLFVLGATGEISEGSSAVYEAWPLMRSRALLPDEITLPDSIPTLVQAAYDDKPRDGEDGEEWVRAREKFDSQRNDYEVYANAYRITTPAEYADFANMNSMNGWLDVSIEDGDAKGEAAVRAGGPSVEVLIMVLGKDGFVRFLPWRNRGRAIPPDCLPSLEECREIARQRLRLPGAICRPWNIEKTISELQMQNCVYIAQWQQSPWLKGQLVLLLNDELTAKVCGHVLRYSREEGLTCEDV